MIRHLVPAGATESMSKLNSLPVLAEAGVAAVSCRTGAQGDCNCLRHVKRRHRKGQTIRRDCPQFG